MKQRLILITLIWLLAGCTPAVSTLVGSSASEPREVLVFAASSLTDAFEEIPAAFEVANPGVRVTLQFAGSSTLAAQMMAGAPADVFASANPAQMDAVRRAGLIDGQAVPFACNQLVLAIPADNPAGIHDLRDLSRSGMLLVVGAPEVPVRVYTDELLAALSREPDFGEDYYAAVMANVVSEEVNVRQVVAKISLGEADAGFVYATDVVSVADVLAIQPPSAANPRAIYPIAVTAHGAGNPLAARFVAFARSPSGQSILTRWGFVAASE